MRTLARVLGAAALAAVVMVAVRGDASAQTPWESPRLLSPSASGGAGLYWVRFSALPGDGGGAFLTLPLAGLPAGASLRLGATKGAAGVTAGFGGIDVSRPLATRGSGAPLDIAWNAGAGAAVGGYLVATVPIGIAAGRAWESGSAWIAPYLGARAVLDVRLGEEAPEEVIDVSPGLDVGLDLSFDRARRYLLRASASVGDRSALALGMLVRAGPRKAVED